MRVQYMQTTAICKRLLHPAECISYNNRQFLSDDDGGGDVS
jgi:hypothetical protein